MRRLLAALLVVCSATVALTTLAPTPAAHAADPRAEADFTNRVNALRASRGTAGLGVHSVLTAKAQAWAQHMADSSCLCHSNLPDGVTVGWRKLGENVGRGPSVASIHDALVNSPGHFANMVDPAYHWIGVGVAYNGGQMYVAEVFMDGDPPPNPGLLAAADTRGRTITARPQGGFYVMEENGVIHSGEGAPAYGYPTFGFPIARDMAVMPDGKGYIVLDGLGGVHRFGSARFSLAGVGGPWFGFDIARSITVAPDGRGFAVLDGFGGVHRFGSFPSVRGLPYWRGWDIAKAITYRPGGGLWLLDAYGKVWASRGTPSYGSPWFGWNIARDIAPWADGRGYAVIDGFGGIHRFGTAKRPNRMPYERLDRWRSIFVQSRTYLALRNDGYPVRV